MLCARIGNTRGVFLSISYLIRWINSLFQIEKRSRKMDIVGMVTRLPTLIFGASRCDDSFADRLSYKYTVLMLVLFAIVVTNKQFGTKHIQCK